MWDKILLKFPSFLNLNLRTDFKASLLKELVFYRRLFKGIHSFSRDLSICTIFPSAPGWFPRLPCLPCRVKCQTNSTDSHSEFEQFFSPTNPLWNSFLTSSMTSRRRSVASKREFDSMDGKCRDMQHAVQQNIHQ